MLLPEKVEVLFLLVYFDLWLRNLVNKLLGLSLHTGNSFDFLDVLTFKHFNLDLILLIFVSLYQKCFQENVYFVIVIQLFEIRLESII